MSGPFILRPRFESQPPTRFLNILNNTLWVFKFGLNCENENEEFWKISRQGGDGQKKFVLNSWNSGRVLSSAVFLSFCRLESELTEYFFSSIHSVVVSSSPHLTQPPWRCFFTGTSLVKPSCPCKFTPSACRIVDDRRTMLARWLSRTEVTAATGSARVSLVD